MPATLLDIPDISVIYYCNKVSRKYDCNIRYQEARLCERTIENHCTNMSSRQSLLVSKADVEHYSSFKARREAEKEAKRQLLAKEFPLLFGNDAKSRSTIGKYANKTIPAASHNPVTPGKRRTQSTLDPSVYNDENSNGNGAFHTSEKPKVSYKSSDSQSGKNGRKSVANRPTQSPKKSSRQTIAATGNARGSFLNYRSFSSQKNIAPIAEVEMYSQEKDSENDASQMMENGANNCFEDPLQEQVSNVLDYLLEKNEVDQGTHRRLSSHQFQKETIRRLSMGERESMKIEVSTTTTEQPNTNNDEASFEIDDMDVLQALRTYISVIDTTSAHSSKVVEVDGSESKAEVVVTRAIRPKNGFSSPTPNTRVVSITSPSGSHFKRPKQLGSPNPIRFPSRSRRDSGLDEDIPANEIRNSVKSPPPAIQNKNLAPISPNPMRLADAFRRGSVSGRKSLQSARKSNAKHEQSMSFMENDDVLGLMTTMEDSDQLATDNASAQKRKSKKQRRRSSAASAQPAMEDTQLIYTTGKNDMDDEHPSRRKSILNSPSLKTMRVSFIAPPVSADIPSSTSDAIVPTSSIGAQFSVASFLAEEGGATTSLVEALDTMMNQFNSEPSVIAVNVNDVRDEATVVTPEVIPVPLAAETVAETTNESTLISIQTSYLETVPNVNEIQSSKSVTTDEQVSKVSTETAQKIVLNEEIQTSNPAIEEKIPQASTKTAPEEAEELVVFNPRQSLYFEAMKRGIVVAELCRCLHLPSPTPSSNSTSGSTNRYVKYMIHVSMLPLPGNPHMFASMTMTLLKRFSEFKQFHQKLVSCPGVNIERIPVLPSRQIASFG